jgi:hypothetical protein
MIFLQGMIMIPPVIFNGTVKNSGPTNNGYEYKKKNKRCRYVFNCPEVKGVKYIFRFFTRSYKMGTTPNPWLPPEAK